ncbi:MAG: chemotaxis response regulator protein-glutamate methylesterase [Candidatus Wallbacteria bacterium HGW-Wallbacteria-1]|jgi:two-component system chemotaxis response regulator CheB|uniref:Protein-glutamate methylesterase/protein-glutamine glutaminase n=1 Tax=Candidatus Wallbacteria bacterium HGW-Wallbacteria-1 TaxID=2013854 RepID=A0A2N1PKM0_9BACT|nr:MAG: chemotaxis response regulator protein-glutamate methylesterase [Candidatus Wallbacteria bacterium HGW-Wallbacteria-1]
MAQGPEGTELYVKVLIVDDSVVYRRLIRSILSSMEDVIIVGEAGNGRDALKMVEELSPEIIALDVEMPIMGGIETLEHLSKMENRPLVIMVSAYTRGGAEITFRCLELGAIDFVAKPDGPCMAENLKTLEKELRRKVGLAQNKALLRRVTRNLPSGRPASDLEHLCSPEGSLNRKSDQQVRNQQNRIQPDRASHEKGHHEDESSSDSRAEYSHETQSDHHHHKLLNWPHQSFDVIAIAISTGGPKALGDVIPLLPANLNLPVLIVQHMPEMFTGVLADSLSKKSRIAVAEARDGETLLPGRVYIAQGGRQMGLIPSKDGGSTVRIRITDDPPENHCRPSADYLFRDLAGIFGARVLAIIMTGMGSDGTRGLLALKLQGARVLAQDMKSCVVYGMPGEALKAGVVDQVINLDLLARAITEAAGQ